MCHFLNSVMLLSYAIYVFELVFGRLRGAYSQRELYLHIVAKLQIQTWEKV